MAGEAARHSMVRGWLSWRSPTASPQPAPSSRRPSGASPKPCSSTRTSSPSEPSPTSPRQAGAGAATVVRLAAKLGFDGFSALQASVQDDLSRQLRPAAERIRELADRPHVERHRANAMANVAETIDNISRDAFDARCRPAQRPAHGPSSCSPERPSREWRQQFLHDLSALRDTVSAVAGNEVAVRRQLALSRRRLDARRHRPAPLRALVARRRGVRQRARTHDRRLHRRTARRHWRWRPRTRSRSRPGQTRRSTVTSARWRCSS